MDVLAELIERAERVIQGPPTLEVTHDFRVLATAEMVLALAKQHQAFEIYRAAPKPAKPDAALEVKKAGFAVERILSRAANR